jgi:mRNA interferase RelE/StbE
VSLADWQYVLLKPAQKYLERMQPDDQLRMIEALDILLTASETLDIKPLKGRSELRLRVGQYRLLFIKDREAKTYVITTIAPRGDVYK